MRSPSHKNHSSMARWLFLLFVGSVFTTVGGNEEKAECDVALDGDSSCSSSVNNDDDDGMDPTGARIAVVTGQIPPPRLCGTWCDHPSTPCSIDPHIIPCQGDFGCTTTCALWRKFILTPSVEHEKPRITLTCPQFTYFVGYTSPEQGAEVCDESCLLPEIRKERYPLPTGVGLMCQAGTCHPFVASQNQKAPALLECPCNWFGSDCKNDWIPIVNVKRTHTYGDLQRITLTVPTKEDVLKLVANHQPGGVIRLVQYYQDGEDQVVAEQPYALAYYDVDNKTFEILSAPPDTVNLAPYPRAVAERVRSLASTTTEEPVQNLYVNPSIAGFFNKDYTFLMDFVQQQESIIRMIVVATGAGLSGALSAMEMMHASDKHTAIHLYYGLRNVADLPYSEQLNDWTVNKGLDLALIESRDDGAIQEEEQAGIQLGVARGRALRGISTTDEKVYVQHALGLDLTVGSLGREKFELSKTIFVVCGRMELLSETLEALQKSVCGENSPADDDCESLLTSRYFTNI